MSHKTTNHYLGKNHPLKQWMKLNRITSKVLARRTGITESGVRAVYFRGSPQKETCNKLYQATGILPQLLMFPERFPDFDISDCKPLNIDESSDKLAAV